MGRSEQNFVLEVVTRGDERRRATARGRDSYAVSSPLACEAIERLLRATSDLSEPTHRELSSMQELSWRVSELSIPWTSARLIVGMNRRIRK